jgi:hypothetical protein
MEALKYSDIWNEVFEEVIKCLLYCFQDECYGVKEFAIIVFKDALQRLNSEKFIPVIKQILESVFD